MVWNDFSLWSPGWCQGDSDICGINEAQRLEFLAHYFNRGEEWGKEVLTTYKHFDSGFNDSSAVADWERGGPAELTRPYWQTDDAISASSWSYTVGISYYSSKQMIHSLLDRVSKNGNMLLNVSPTAAGVLPAAQVQVLRDIGAYLGRYAEAVYATRAWDIYGEGPNRAGGGSFTAPLQGNSSDIRFTRSQDEKVLYATILGWPADRLVNIESLGSDRLVDISGLTGVQLLGDTAGEYLDVVDSQQNAGGLAVTLPSTQPAEAYGYVLKLTFSERIPVPQPAQGATVWPAGGQVSAATKGVTLGLGDFRGIFLSEAGVEGSKVGVIRVSAGSKVSVFASSDLSGDVAVVYTEGEHAVEEGSVGSVRVEAA
ncbi:alpha-L-fucosidase-domain-containing protein [Microdochium trichocladiopsis]|uniref:alpha-L-fucosidase n=1 Tax=Microdochium trichocladiopsis TaxID=1682393 RepID=A0A9P8XYG9_9PEZI|nr:alpha-L-fucosidase-domain-containing protein [Microdochium trichocladiopsis]KAH7025097.1 alpha-L-fucosidase-domain-containing protein [Microdochium trichocladiopsis]